MGKDTRKHAATRWGWNLAAAAALASPAWSQSAPEVLEAELARLLPSEAGTHELPGAMLLVEAPAHGLAWSGAVGASDLATGEALRPDQPLRIASMTKSFVAAAVLRLMEEGRLSLDAPVADHLRPGTAEALRQDGYDPGAITVRMLLQHTSGLYDFAASEAYMGRVAQDPRHRWTREEQVGLAMEVGEPTGAPGEAYAYSDTGYLLLGEILEMVTSQPMAEAIRDLLRFEEIGLASTWWESLEPVPASTPPRAHQYLQGMEANDFDPSLDLWGGGGLVSTLGDVAAFYRTLLTGGVFEDPATLALMIEPTPLSLGSDGHGYGMGLVREEIAGVTCYGHGGFWSTLAWHCPDLDLTVAAATTEVTAKDAVSTMVEGAVGVVAGATDGGP
jgi:D-alanyl-D-alanine carboxypeptidase